MNPQPKPEPRVKVKARLARLWQKARRRSREIRYRMDGGCCVDCGRPLVLHPAEARHEFEIAHIDEIKPRSLGGDPLNPDEQQTLCYACHARKTEHR